MRTHRGCLNNCIPAIVHRVNFVAMLAEKHRQRVSIVLQVVSNQYSKSRRCRCRHRTVSASESDVSSDVSPSQRCTAGLPLASAEWLSSVNAVSALAEVALGPLP
jgi:hypothetical protein